jgi:uncharacterized Zn finger protein (UPF0148 family)
MAEPVPEFDCRQCGLPLMLLKAEGSPVGYYRCPRCDRQTATSYSEGLRQTARPHATADDRAEETLRQSELREVRDRLDRWLAKAEGSDPFVVLGLRPSASLHDARERFHELALQHHPDRGGNAEQMRRFIEAYDLVRDRLSHAARSAPAVPVRPAPRPTGLVKRKPESWARARSPAQTREDS